MVTCNVTSSLLSLSLSLSLYYLAKIAFFKLVATFDSTDTSLGNGDRVKIVPRKEVSIGGNGERLQLTMTTGCVVIAIASGFNFIISIPVKL